MKISRILKDACHTSFSEKVYRELLDSLNRNLITIQIRLDYENHGVCIFGGGVYVDITEDLEGVKVAWHQMRQEPEVAYLHGQRIDL